ncbi:hypothetical protein SKAU_G00410200 [Synaphobranchus kaupii]|uniref:Uncharacterized protein n=1 Tax=Synaphobranchus kaupii TaxID=118154 RepID=A0A9Q1E7L7_SYNKA|nr:hypothetical protein SKAU_G00410200 [Synaphobranchus kaupii]
MPYLSRGERWWSAKEQTRSRHAKLHSELCPARISWMDEASVAGLTPLAELCHSRHNPTWGNQPSLA